MERRDYLLLGVTAAGGKKLTPVQIQKLMFLLRDSMPHKDRSGMYEFKPYHYGPFDSNVYSDAEQLEAMGLVSIDRTGTFKTYAATPAGMDRDAELRAVVPRWLTTHLKDLVEWMMPLSFAELVRAVYDKHPEFRKNSVFEG